MALTPSAIAKLARAAASAAKRARFVKGRARLLRRAKRLLRDGLSLGETAVELGVTRMWLAANLSKAHGLEIGRPAHSYKYAQFSDAWFAACNAAFVAAMLANPSERPGGVRAHTTNSDPQVSHPNLSPFAAGEM